MWKISQKVKLSRKYWRLVVLMLTVVFVADIISTVEFDQTGNYLATGDKGGRVVLFERNEGVRLCLSAGSLAHAVTDC